MRRITDKELAARNYAIAAHVGQKYNLEPYVEHPARVVSRLAGMGHDDPDLFVVAWLHDVIEDTTYLTLDEIEEEFGKRVRDAVDAISRRKYQGGPNAMPVVKESEESYLARVRANEVARIVKLADMNDNLMMTAAPDCTPEKKKLWRKYLNAIAYLSGEDRAYNVVLQPLYTNEEYAEMRKDREFDEEYD